MVKVKPLVWVAHTQVHPADPEKIMYWSAETPFWKYKIHRAGDRFSATDMGVPSFPSLEAAQTYIWETYRDMILELIEDV